MNRRLIEYRKIYRSTFDMDYYFMRYVKNILRTKVDAKLLFRNLDNAKSNDELLAKAYVISSVYCLDPLYLGCNENDAEKVFESYGEVVRILSGVLDICDKLEIASWLHIRAREYLKAADRIVNLEFRKFKYKGQTRTQKQMVEILINVSRMASEDSPGEKFEELMEIWALIHHAMWW